MKKCTVVLVYQLCQIISMAAGTPGAGMRMTMSEKTMQDINRNDISDIESKLRGARFRTLPGSSNGFDYKLHRLTVSHLDSLTTNLTLQPSDQVTWRGHISAVTVTADYWFRYSFLGWDIDKSGSVTVRLRGMSVAVIVNIRVRNGQVAVDFDRCSATIKDLSLEFSGSRLATVLNKIAAVFIDYIRSELERTFCDVEKYILYELSREMTNIKTRVNISVVGLPVVIDASISGVTVGHDGICVYTKADFLWSGRVFRSMGAEIEQLAKSGHGVGIDLPTDAFSKLLSAMATSGRFNGGLGYREIKTRGIELLNFRCEGVCIGKVLKMVHAIQDQPSSVLGIHWAVRRAELDVRAGEMLGTLAGRAFFKAENGTNSELLFSAELNLTANFQARFTGNTLSFRAVGIGGLVQIDQSMIGKVLSPRWQFPLEKVILKGVGEQVLRMLNDYETELRFPLPPRTSFDDAVVRLYPGVIRVETDVCYPKACATNTAKWVGKYQTGIIRIEDTLPEEVTATTTSTATEKPVTMTTNKAIPPVSSSAVSLSASANATTIIPTTLTTAMKYAPTVTTTTPTTLTTAMKYAPTVTTTTPTTLTTAMKYAPTVTTTTPTTLTTAMKYAPTVTTTTPTTLTTAMKYAPTVTTTTPTTLTTAMKYAPTVTTTSRHPLVSTSATTATSSGLPAVVSATPTSGYTLAAISTQVSGSISTPPETAVPSSLANSSSDMYKKQTSGQSGANSWYLHMFLTCLFVQYCVLLN